MGRNRWGTWLRRWQGAGIPETGYDTDIEAGHHWTVMRLLEMGWPQVAMGFKTNMVEFLDDFEGTPVLRHLHLCWMVMMVDTACNHSSISKQYPHFYVSDMGSSEKHTIFNGHRPRGRWLIPGYELWAAWHRSTTTSDTRCGRKNRTFAAAPLACGPMAERVPAASGGFPGSQGSQIFWPIQGIPRDSKLWKTCIMIEARADNGSVPMI